MANPPSRAQLIGNIRRQLRQIAEHRRDNVDLRPVEWDMICEALGEAPSIDTTPHECLDCNRVYAGAESECVDCGGAVVGMAR